MTYTVYASLFEDINSGYVWIGGFTGKQRTIVKITNRSNQKSVYCEALRIDQNFIKKYNNGNTIKPKIPDNSIVANEWYRTKLDINKNTDENLAISPENHLIGKFMACIHHPQIIVRLATWLSIISISLGLISFF